MRLSGKVAGVNQAYLFNNGTNVQCHRMLGAHPWTSREGESGYRFAVWAPRARSVSVVGDFNGWTTGATPLSPLGTTGIWVGQSLDARDWQRYKYAVEGVDGQTVLKADPCARHAETRPGTASILYNASGDYTWHDDAFLRARQATTVREPLVIYEMHLGSWRRYRDGNVYNYRETADQLVTYLGEMGYNAVELMPLMEYPLDASWGYQVTGMFAATSRYGVPSDLKYLVDTLHKAGIKVIFDLVLAHFPRDAWGLARFDGAPLYEADNESDAHATWGTLAFNYALAEVVSFLLSVVWFWIDEFHADGLRLDAVTAMIYNDHRQAGATNDAALAFLRRATTMVHEHFPGVLMIAEESSAYPNVTGATDAGGLGFDYKWNMGFMNDTLRYMERDHYARADRHDLVTFQMTYAFSERFLLPFSHDETVHGKKTLLGRMPGDYWRQFASLRTLFMYQYAFPGAVLNFMGNELGLYLEWRYYEELEWFMLKYPKHAEMQAFVRALNRLYRATPSLWQRDDGWHGFAWRLVDDRQHEVFAFERIGDDGATLVILNMTPASYPAFTVPVARKGTYVVRLNSDDDAFGGSGYLGEAMRFTSYDGETLDMPLPPLAGLYLETPSDMRDDKGGSR